MQSEAKHLGIPRRMVTANGIQQDSHMEIPDRLRNDARSEKN